MKLTNTRIRAREDVVDMLRTKYSPAEVDLIVDQAFQQDLEPSMEYMLDLLITPREEC